MIFYNFSTPHNCVGRKEIPDSRLSKEINLSVYPFKFPITPRSRIRNQNSMHFFRNRNSYSSEESEELTEAWWSEADYGADSSLT